MAKLKYQIAQLMAVLTQNGWGNGLPASRVVPGNMAVDVGAVKEAAIVVWTLTTVGMAPYIWLKPAVFWQNMWEKLWGEEEVNKGT